MNSYKLGMLLHKYNIEFLLQPAQSPDLNMLDLGAWWSLGTAVNEIRYDPTWIQRAQKSSDILRDLNDTDLHSWNSWHTNRALAKLQNTFHCNHWSVESSKGTNAYDRLTAPESPTTANLTEHLEKAKLDPLWSEDFSL